MLVYKWRKKSLEYIDHAIRTKSIIWNQFGELVEKFMIHEMDPLYTQLKLSRQIYLNDLRFNKNKHLFNDDEHEQLINEIEKIFEERL